MSREFPHPVSHDLTNTQLDKLAADYQSQDVTWIQNLNIAWDLDTPFDKYHDISDAEFADGLMVRVTAVNFLRSILGLPRQYRPGNFWNTPAIRETVGVLYCIKSGRELTPPWLIFDEPGPSLYVRSGHNRFAVAFINKSGEFPILLTPNDAVVFDKLLETECSSAYFEFRGSNKKDFFVMKLVDPATIEHARAILRGDETSAIHPQGTIVSERVPYNPRWSYHFDPASISFFREAIELCDANMGFIEEHLDEVGGSFLPNAHWCPWSSKLVREISRAEVHDEHCE